jgi:hypothetical protein
MPRSRRNRTRRIGWLAVALLSSTTAAADPLSDRQRLAGDYFVGASVFLFERTVLAAFIPADVRQGQSAEAMLDAGPIVVASQNATDEFGSVPLQAMLGWLNAALGAKDSEAAQTPPPGLEKARLRGIACLAYGSAPQIHHALATHGAFSEAERVDCVTQFLAAQKIWAEWLKPYRRDATAPGPSGGAAEPAPVGDEPVLRLAFGPAVAEAHEAIAVAIRENGLFQVLTDDLNATLRMPRALTALITQCGEPRAFYNPDRGEAVLCYEMLGALMQAAP